MTTVDDDLRDELVAMMRAREELPAHDEQLAAAFLQRLDRDIDARIAAQIAAQVPKGKGRKPVNPIELLGLVLGIAIPLSAVGAWAAHLTGLIVVWAALAVITFLATRQ